MKKLVLVFVAVAAMSFASCGGNANQPAPAAEDSIAVVDEADSLAADSMAADSAEAEAAAEEAAPEAE